MEVALCNQKLEVEITVTLCLMNYFLKEKTMHQYDSPEERAKRMLEAVKKNLKWAALAAVVLLIIITLFSGMFTTPQGHKTVIFRFGKYVRTLGPGLNFKVPLGVETASTLSVEKVYREPFGFRTQIDKKGQETKAIVPAEGLLLTGDLCVGTMEWVVQYTVSDPLAYLIQVRSPRELLRDMSEYVVSKTVGDLSLNELLRDRDLYRAIMAQDLQSELDKVNSGMKIVSVEVREANVPDPVKASYNLVDQNKQKKETMIFDAKQQYNEQIPRAKGEAKAIIDQAHGKAAQIVNAAQGRLDRFEQEYTAYKKAPRITELRMYMDAMSAVLHNTTNTVVDGDVDSMLPLYNINKGGK